MNNNTNSNHNDIAPEATITQNTTTSVSNDELQHITNNNNVNVQSYVGPTDSVESSSNTADEENEINSFNAQNVKDYEANVGGELPPDDELSRIESNTELSRRATRSIMNTESLLRTASQSSKPLPPMGGGKEYPQCLVHEILMLLPLMVPMILIILIIIQLGKNCILCICWSCCLIGIHGISNVFSSKC